jgi:hypothetical protein
MSIIGMKKSNNEKGGTYSVDGVDEKWRNKKNCLQAWNKQLEDTDVYEIIILKRIFGKQICSYETDSFDSV